jgi:hypothetical protein
MLEKQKKHENNISIQCDEPIKRFNHKVKPKIKYDFLIRCHMA